MNPDGAGQRCTRAFCFASEDFRAHGVPSKCPAAGSTAQFDLYVTGSNARLLSSELATLLTGRAFEINVLPFSFREFIQTWPASVSQERMFKDYLRMSAFPQAVNLMHVNRELVPPYLLEIYKSILQKDHEARRGIVSGRAFQNVVNFTVDSIGSPLSPNKIAARLKGENQPVDGRTVEGYLTMLTDSYLLYRADRYDIKGRQHLATQEKYYLVDTGLRHALRGKELQGDSGHLLENIIYLELRRRGHQVWIGKIGGSEVDFVVRDRQGYTRYIQVAWTVAAPETLRRELAPFDKIPDHNERILITADWETGSRNGVRQINAMEWLLDFGNGNGIGNGNGNRNIG
jgi:predicted AAA+ superfamily ATPase